MFIEVAADVAFALHSLELEELRRRAEQALELERARLEALLKLSQMTQATLQEITDFALEEAVRLTQSKIGYLAFMNEDESVLTMHSWSKTAMAQCAMIDKPIVYPVETTGLWGEAVRQRQPVITNDYAAPNPLKKGYPEGHVPVRPPHEHPGVRRRADRGRGGRGEQGAALRRVGRAATDAADAGHVAADPEAAGATKPCARRTRSWSGGCSMRTAGSGGGQRGTEARSAICCTC